MIPRNCQLNTGVPGMQNACTVDSFQVRHIPGLGLGLQLRPAPLPTPHPPQT